MGLLSVIMNNPSVGNLVLNYLKMRAFKPYKIPIEKALEIQNDTLLKKFKKMQKTDLGKKLNINTNTKINEIKITDYNFYEPFYNKAHSSTLMYPIEAYIKVKTSGTAGTEKSFLLPEKAIITAFRETALQSIFALFHDGEKINLERGDVIYVNTGGAPFVGGTTVSIGSKKNPFISMVPNVNLSYFDKVQYFVRNYSKIDAAFMLVPTLLKQIMSVVDGPINLKGFATFETPSIDENRKKIENFIGTIPKSFYASTETHSCSVMSVEHSMGFIFDYRRGLFEFFPVRAGETIGEEPLPMNEVKVGETYQLIYTDLHGELTRYDTKDCLRCIAKGDSIISTDFPVFRVVGRLDKIISIQNYTRISEQELLIVLEEAGVSYDEFTTRIETRDGKEYLAIYLEVLAEEKSNDLLERIHKVLYSIDSDYKDLVDHLEYIPITTYLVPSGVFAKYLEEKSGSAAKVDRIGMKDEEFNKFAQIMDTMKSDT